jgi:hypothetical protein
LAPGRPHGERLSLSITDWGHDASDDTFWVIAYVEGKHRDDHHLRLDLRYGRRAGVPELISIEVQFAVHVPVGGLTTDDLRAIRLGELHARIAALLREGRESDWGPSSRVGNPPMPPRDWATELEKRPRPGRSGRGDRWYAEAAQAYVVAHRSGPTPVKAVAKAQHISPSQLRNVLHQARARGLLTASASGKAGGELTEKARTILGEAGRQEREDG